MSEKAPVLGLVLLPTEWLSPGTDEWLDGRPEPLKPEVCELPDPPIIMLLPLPGPWEGILGPLFIDPLPVLLLLSNDLWTWT